MKIMNGHRYYENKDMEKMFKTLESIEETTREQIEEYIMSGGKDMDRNNLLNIFRNPTFYDMDYLDSLDSAVADKFIRIMEKFNLV